MLTKAPKGTRDNLPGEVHKWQYAEGLIREKCALYNFTEIRTPIFEHTELFLRGVGDTTDVVQKEMYTFEDKGGRSITLRPEGTAGVARAFIESGLAAGPQPTKLYYLAAPVFRYEKPQAGRLRQHHQFGVEVFGAAEASMDAEVIALALDIIGSVGVHSLGLNINSIGCPECRPKYNEALVEFFRSREDQLCPTCRERLHKNPLRILDCKEEKCRALSADAPLMIDYLCGECHDHFESLKAYLAALGIEFRVDPKIVRGLDYYTKTVFEIISTDIGSQGTVCGGGRYDGLIEQLGGPKMCGVGFGMGLERLLMVAEATGAELPAQEKLKLFICTRGDEARLKAAELCAAVKAVGVSCDTDHCARSVKAQFKYANKLGARYVLTIGESELETGSAKLRCMEDGSERDVRLSDVAGILADSI